MDFKIYVATHTPARVLDNDLYALLHTGQDYDRKVIPNAMADNSGFNISIKKPQYDGLLTGLYWIWKNTSHAIVGQCHYRRYFLTDDLSKIIDKEYLAEMFINQGYDILLPRRDLWLSSEDYNMQFGYRFFYDRLHDPVEYIRDIIKNRCPEYLDSYEWCWKANKINFLNAFIASNEVFNGLCDWMFGIFEEAEDYFEKVNYEIPPRFFGYFAEHFIRVYLVQNYLKVKELPTVMDTKKEIDFSPYARYCKDFRISNGI